MRQVLFAIVDLAQRWHYTKAGVHKLAQQENFPLPIAVVCHGRIKLYALLDVQEYEKHKPWLFDVNMKEQRVKGHLRALGRVSKVRVE